MIWNLLCFKGVLPRISVKRELRSGHSTFFVHYRSSRDNSFYIFIPDAALIQAINGLKHVESSAMLQFLQPTLNMLLRMIGDGGETLQVLVQPCGCLVLIYLFIQI
jgi:hypothetical protein